MKRILRNGFNDSFKAKTIASDTNDQLFIWKHNFDLIDKASVKEEKRSYKRNSIKSRSSKYAFQIFKKHEMKFLNYRINTMREVKKLLIKKGLLTIDVLQEEPIEVFGDQDVKDKVAKFETFFQGVLTKVKGFEKKYLDLLQIKSADKTVWKQKLAELEVHIKREQTTLDGERAKLIAFIQNLKDVSSEKETIDQAKIKEINQLIKSKRRDACKEFDAKAKSGASSKAKESSLNKLEQLFLKTHLLERKLFVSQAILPLLEESKELSFDLLFLYRKTVENIRYASTEIANRKKYALEFNHLHTKINTVKRNQGNYNTQRANFVVDKVKLKKEWRSAKLTARQELKAGSASRRAKKVSFKRINAEYRTKLRELEISKINLVNFKNELSIKHNTIFRQIRKDRRIHFAILKDILKATPIEVSTKKYWASIAAGSILPGLGALIHRQYAKALFQLTGTAICILILTWVFGAYPSATGNGLIGLINLGYDATTATPGFAIGTVNGKPVDGRFYLVMGAVALVLLVAVLLYWLVSILTNINSNNLGRIGVRYTNWRLQREILKSSGIPYLLSAPALIFITFIVVVPIVATVFITFTNINERFWDPVDMLWKYSDGIVYPFSWQGFSQYGYIFKVAGDEFGGVFLWTMIWTFGTATAVIIMGTGLAILVNQSRIKGKTFFRVVYLLPWSVPAFVTIMFFTIFLSHDGIFNKVIGNAIFGPNTDWLNAGNKTKAMMIFLQTWLGHSYMVLLITGILQSIPSSLYEASRMDGASVWKQFRTITFPIILIQVAPMLIGQFTFAFNNFTFIYLFNGGGVPPTGKIAGPNDIFISWIYKLIITPNNPRPGAAAAISLLISIFTITPSAFLFARSRSFRRENF